MGRRHLRSMRIVAILAMALVALGAMPAAAAAAAAPPKVAIIVGPVGPSITPRYRQAADAAAAVAATITPNVVKVYSPDATWPAVRDAVTGASVVVYLGHGNGWPSPYTKALRASTQDGFGLNPVAGVDDTAHQYYGESFVAKLALAPGAVVLLSHLCYASGSSEPGLADGTFSDVLSRVDNFAAGFLAAGAGAVVAEGHANPAQLMAAALQGSAAVAKAWNDAPWGHGHIAAYASTRTAGATIALDPDKEASGYYRSLVRRSGAAPAPATVRAPAVAVTAGPPSLAAAGARFGTAVVDAVVAPGQSTSIRVPVSGPAAALPASLLLGVRWLPLVAPSTDAGSTSNDPGLIVGESSGDVVDTAKATASGGTMALEAAAPSAPGIYVVVLTLETADGTPYDLATQALLRPFTVTVPRPVDLRITAPSGLTAKPGTPLRLPVGLANTGTQAWGSALYASIWADPLLDPVLARTFDNALSLSAAWLDLTSGAVSTAASYPLPRELGAPGRATQVRLQVLAPSAPGPYLLLLSLSVRGNLGEFPQNPLFVPVTIEGGPDAVAPAPSAVPAPGAAASPGVAPAPSMAPAPSIAPAPSAPSVAPAAPATS